MGIYPSIITVLVLLGSPWGIQSVSFWKGEQRDEKEDKRGTGQYNSAKAVVLRVYNCAWDLKHNKENSANGKRSWK